MSPTTETPAEPARTEPAYVAYVNDTVYDVYYIYDDDDLVYDDYDAHPDDRRDRGHVGCRDDHRSDGNGSTNTAGVIVDVCVLLCFINFVFILLGTSDILDCIFALLVLFSH